MGNTNIQNITKYGIKDPVEYENILNQLGGLKQKQGSNRGKNNLNIGSKNIAAFLSALLILGSMTSAFASENSQKATQIPSDFFTVEEEPKALYVRYASVEREQRINKRSAYISEKTGISDQTYKEYMKLLRGENPYSTNLEYEEYFSVLSHMFLKLVLISSHKDVDVNLMPLLLEVDEDLKTKEMVELLANSIGKMKSSSSKDNINGAREYLELANTYFKGECKLSDNEPEQILLLALFRAGKPYVDKIFTNQKASTKELLRLIDSQTKIEGISENLNLLEGIIFNTCDLIYIKVAEPVTPEVEFTPNEGHPYMING